MRGQGKAWKEKLNEQLVTMDMSEAGTVLRMYAAIKASEGRMSKNETIDVFLAVERHRWQEQLISLDNAADQTPVLGLAGSLIGILGSLGAGANIEMLQQAMSVMISTTLLGCCGAVWLIRLHGIGQSAIDRHVAELEIIAKFMIDDNDSGDDIDSFDSLLGGKSP